MKLLNILAASEESLSQIRKSSPRYHDGGEIRIGMITTERKRILSEINTLMTVNNRDFVAIDGFWMIRRSNTQPHLTIRCEAASRTGLADCMRDLQENLRICGYEGNELNFEG